MWGLRERQQALPPSTQPARARASTEPQGGASEAPSANGSPAFRAQESEGTEQDSEAAARGGGRWTALEFTAGASDALPCALLMLSPERVRRTTVKRHFG
jgi:hypothetical protein